MYLLPRENIVTKIASCQRCDIFPDVTADNTREQVIETNTKSNLILRMIHIITLHEWNTPPIGSNQRIEICNPSYTYPIESSIHWSFSQASEADRRGRASSSGRPGGPKGCRPAPRTGGGGGRRKRKDHHRFGQKQIHHFWTLYKALTMHPKHKHTKTHLQPHTKHD